VGLDLLSVAIVFIVFMAAITMLPQDYKVILRNEDYRLF
jgi:hypothetical protein